MGGFFDFLSGGGGNPQPSPATPAEDPAAIAERRAVEQSERRRRAASGRPSNILAGETLGSSAADTLGGTV